MTVGSVVAAGSAGCEKCPYPGCTFAFDPERCTNKDADGEWCNQLFHHMCQTELEMEAWRKSTHNVDELIAARTGNPFESATTKICYHCHEKIINPPSPPLLLLPPSLPPSIYSIPMMMMMSLPLLLSEISVIVSISSQKMQPRQQLLKWY
mmetsp:Transcript_36983/g.75395  ORF Transcript_36983/g.75395 Transcript_36983/m.75395 type:complete len:151 (-) Transcript_36983:544-996(-)